MGLLTNILLAPFTAPVSGLRFVLNTLRKEAETQADNQEHDLQEELVALNMRLELGQISEQDFEANEAAVLDKLRALRASSPPVPE
jgi:hypothetical protein